MQMSPSVSKRVHIGYYSALGALATVGLIALGYRLAVGMKVTALTTSISWGMWVSAYIYFIGLSAGSFLLSTLVYVFGMRQFEKVGRIALLSAFFSLAAGMLFIWLDLGHPFRFWEIGVYPHWTSVMTIESWLYVSYLAIILAELWLLMRSDLAALGEETPGPLGVVYRMLALNAPAPPSELGPASAARAHRWGQ